MTRRAYSLSTRFTHGKSHGGVPGHRTVAPQRNAYAAGWIEGDQYDYLKLSQ